MNDIVVCVARVSQDGSPVYNNSEFDNGITIIGENLEYIEDIYPESLTVIYTWRET